MKPNRRRNGLLIAGAALLVASAIFFPRLLVFLERAAVELRYLWWLVLLLAFGVWLAFFVGRKRD